METLRKLYRLFWIWQRSLIGVGMEVKYPTPEVKRQIVEALTLWKFIQEKFDGATDWEVRREFLRDYLDFNNRYVAIVAMLESMPTSIFRLMLWRYNLDFMSLESCLRRLTETQINLIMSNFVDLFIDHKLPRVMGKIKCFLNMTSVGSLYEEKLDLDSRYERKAKMSYDFAYLGIGFNAFPNGVKDDTEDCSKSARRFLSIKNHSDDFVNNREFGRYNWLFRTARSNPAYKPNREVKMNKWVCPGFYFTMIAHGLFWIISPIACIILTKLYVSGGYHLSSIGWWYGVLLGLPATITPGWVSLFLLRFTITSIITPLKDTVDESENFEKYFTRPIGYFFLGILCCAGTGFASFVLYKIYSGLATVFTEPGALFVMYVIGRYCLEEIYSVISKNRLQSFKNFSLDFKLIMPYFLLIILKPFSDLYYAIIIEKLRYLLFERQLLAAVIGLVAFQAVVSLLAIVLPSEIKDDRSERVYQRLEKIITWTTIISLPTVFVIMLWQSIYYHDYILMLMLLLLMVFPAAGYYIGRTTIWVDYGSHCHIHNIRDLDMANLILNKWIQSLAKDKRKEIEVSICNFVDLNTSWQDSKKIWRLIAKGINEKFYKEILKLEGIPNHFGLFAIQLIFKGVNAEDAWNLAAEEYKKADEKSKKFQAFKKWVNRPAEKLMEKLMDSIEASCKIFTDLYKLGVDIFHNSCPFWLEPGKVKLSGSSAKADEVVIQEEHDYSPWDD